MEDWYHICGVEHLIPEESWPSLESRVVRNTHRILDILAEKGVSATFFVLGFVADRHPALIRTVKEAGHEIASHGYSHRRVYTLSQSEFHEDLKRSLSSIMGITGEKVRGYRAPEWSIRDDSSWALDVLLEEGIVYDSSMAPLHVIGNPSYPIVPHSKNLKKGHLWELPPLVGSLGPTNLPLGGGWGLRVFPYTLTRSCIKKLNARGFPALVYFHPREFDPGNPRVRLPFLKRFVVEARVASAKTRLMRLLREFRFTSVQEYINNL